MKELMSLRSMLMLFALALGVATVANSQGSQYPIADQVAQKVIGHYQQTSCADLWKEKMQGPSAQKDQMQQKAVQAMQNDPQMRKYFISLVATPIANKMFECGMVP